MPTSTAVRSSERPVLQSERGVGCNVPAPLPVRRRERQLPEHALARLPVVDRRRPENGVHRLGLSERQEARA